MSLALMTRALANRPLDALPRLRRRAVQILPALFIKIAPAQAGAVFLVGQAGFEPATKRL